MLDLVQDLDPDLNWIMIRAEPDQDSSWHWSRIRVGMGMGIGTGLVLRSMIRKADVGE